VIKWSIKFTIKFLLLGHISIFADNNLQESVYDAAEEMMQFDEKMNRLIAEHNGEEYEKEKMSSIIDFEETKNTYVLERDIEDNNNTQIELRLENGLLTIETTVREQEEIRTETQSSYETIMSKSSMSLYIPSNADENTMHEEYKNGILKVTFLKK
jgi:HSP20 family molecular chaperone IbpA